MVLHLAILALCQIAAPVIRPTPLVSDLPDSSSRVRIAFGRPNFHGRVVGTFLGADSVSLRIRREQLDPLTVPGADSVIEISRASITRLEIGGVPVANSRRDALVGGVFGGVTGLVYGIAVQCGVSHFIGCYHDPASIAGTTVVGGLSGAALGAIIGSFSHHDGWRPVGQWGQALIVASGLQTRIGLSLAVPPIR